MKKQIKNNQGFALTGVIVLVAIMTIFGTSMYVYSMQALKTLEFGTNRQKAEYLARSGIEAAVYMYQDTLLNVGGADDPTNQLQSFIAKSGNDGNNATDDTITTNWIYMLDTKRVGADGKKQIQYVDGGNGETPNPIGETYVGYFRVTITNDKKTYDMPTGTTDSNGNAVTQTKTEYIKRFKSVAYVGERAATKNAYIIPVVDISNKGWVDNDGIIRLVNCNSDETSVIYNTTVTLDCGALDKLSSKLYEWFGIGSAGKRISNVPMTLGITSGNMVVSMPNNSDKMSFEYIDNGNVALKKDNIAGFISMNNLFVEPAIDIKPDKSRFNVLYLRGNEIVLDNSIDLYIYDPGINYSKDQANSNFISNIISKTQALLAKISKNYRLGTVVIGTSSQAMSSVTDPMPTISGGLGNCGKIFFGGDVYLNFISTQGTRKYKIFTAGDVYYFDGTYEMNGSPYGVDLVKFFLDTAKARGYSGTVLQQFERTRDFYYDSVNNVYKLDDMRKIDVGGNIYDEIEDLVIPSSGDTACIIWD